MAPKTWILCLEVKKHILIKTGLGFEEEVKENPSKILKIKFLLVYSVSRKDTLLKNYSLEGKQKDGT